MGLLVPCDCLHAIECRSFSFFYQSTGVSYSQDEWKFTPIKNILLGVDWMKWWNMYFAMQLNDNAEEIWSILFFGGLENTCFHRCSNMKRYRSIFFSIWQANIDCPIDNGKGKNCGFDLHHDHLERKCSDRISAFYSERFRSAWINRKISWKTGMEMRHDDYIDERKKGLVRFFIHFFSFFRHISILPLCNSR